MLVWGNGSCMVGSVCWLRQASQLHAVLLMLGCTRGCELQLAVGTLRVVVALGCVQRGGTLCTDVLCKWGSLSGMGVGKALGREGRREERRGSLLPVCVGHVGSGASGAAEVHSDSGLLELWHADL